MSNSTEQPAVLGPVQRGVRPSLLTEKELLDIVDTLIRDRAYNRPAAIAIGVAVGSAVEAEIRERMQIALREWAVSRWRDEVQCRPLVNKHRRTLDDTWRQVMRHAGLDPDQAVGPSHDALLAGDRA